MSSLRSVFSGIVRGFAIMAAGVGINTDSAINDNGKVESAAKNSVENTTPATTGTFANNATILDLSANPHDYSQTASHIVTKVKDALAADQKIIVMLGEEHHTVAHVRLIELVRQELHRAGINDPVIAIEENNRLVEEKLQNLYPGDDQADLREKIERALAKLKQRDAQQYHRLQTLALASTVWAPAPHTRLENTSEWLRSRQDVRLIDIATKYNNLDTSHPHTAAFVAAILPDTGNRKRIRTLAKEGIQLRNLWMSATLRSILAEKSTRVILLQTGLAHIGGSLWDNWSYDTSLHPYLTAAAKDENFKVVSVFQENNAIRYNGFLSAAARAAMDNHDTIIVRKGCNEKYATCMKDSPEKEAAALARIAAASKMPLAMPTIEDENSYDRQRQYFINALDKLLRYEIDNDTTPAPQQAPAPPHLKAAHP